MSDGMPWTEEEQVAWEARMAEGAEHRRHTTAARVELLRIAKDFGAALIGWEHRFGMTVGDTIRLRRAAVSTSAERPTEIVRVDVEAGL